MSRNSCAECGAQLEQGAATCPSCGAPTAQPSVATARATGGVPPEVWVAIGALALPGAWIALDAVRALPDALRLTGDFFRAGLAITLLEILLVLLGAGLVAVAALVQRRDLVGRGLAFVASATVIVTCVFADGRSDAELVALLGAVVTIGILGFAPAAKAWFAEVDAGAHGLPTSIVVSRRTLTAFAGVALIAGLVHVLLGDFRTRWYLIGVILLGAAYFAWLRGSALATAARTVRRDLSIAAGALLLLVVLFGDRDAALMVPVALLASAVGVLWLAPDARRYFGDSPLDLGPLGVKQS